MQCHYIYPLLMSKFTIHFVFNLFLFFSFECCYNLISFSTSLLDLVFHFLFPSIKGSSSETLLRFRICENHEIHIYLKKVISTKACISWYKNVFELIIYFSQPLRLLTLSHWRPTSYSWISFLNTWNEIFWEIIFLYTQCLCPKQEYITKRRQKKFNDMKKH